MVTLEKQLAVCNEEADELYDQAKMWQATAAVAEETARVAVASFAAETAAKAALRRTVRKYRTVVEKARRMSWCKWLRSRLLEIKEINISLYNFVNSLTGTS